jgi:hypothetical protein
MLSASNSVQDCIINEIQAAKILLKMYVVFMLLINIFRRVY